MTYDIKRLLFDAQTFLTFLDHSVFHLIIFQKGFEIRKRKYYGIGTNYQNILDAATEPLILIT